VPIGAGIHLAYNGKIVGYSQYICITHLKPLRYQFFQKDPFWGDLRSSTAIHEGGLKSKIIIDETGIFEKSEKTVAPDRSHCAARSRAGEKRSLTDSPLTALY
jgi:hypothetical protein